MQMIGQTPTRYDGYGCGNISQRLLADTFVINGTQTGGIEDLLPKHYATILSCHPEQNRVVAKGPTKPSSESMTHEVVYAQDSTIHWVFHVHDPHIWRQATKLHIPTTHASVPYGTPEMSVEVERLFAESDVRERKIFSMGGHEEGIATFGSSAEEAGDVLLNFLAASLRSLVAL